MKDKLEKRSRPIEEYRADADDGRVMIRGHAAVFDSPTVVWTHAGEYEERIERGAFSEALKRKDDVILNVNHSGLPLARLKSGTLELKEDDVGLAVRAELDMSDPDVQRIVPKLNRGDLSQMSFAFWVDDELWEREGRDMPLRTVRSVRLDDVSIVTRAVYKTTDVAVAARALEEFAAADDAEALERSRERARAGYRARVELKRKLAEARFRTPLC